MSEQERVRIRRKRGIVCASTTQLKTKIRDLEDKTDDPDTHAHTRRILQKLEALDCEFKDIHYSLVELLEVEDDLQREQTILDEHDDDMVQLSIGVEHLLSSCRASSLIADPNSKRMISRKLSRLQQKLESINVASVGDHVDRYLLQQHGVDLVDYKRELGDIHQELLLLELEESDELITSHVSLEEAVFDTSIKIRRLLQPEKEPPSPDGSGVKLPRLDVPKFDGNILGWKTFWEQFNVSVHVRRTLSDAEKLVYLRNSVSEGSAKFVIEGLARTGECYVEAIECLQARYDRPRHIHQTHVKMIVDAQNLRDGNDKELRHLHDTVQQHLRALKAMEYEPSGPFITSILELKLDSNTMFEWQKYSQRHIDVPPYQELLEFLNLRAHASETSVYDQQRPKSIRNDSSSTRRGHYPNKPVTSYAVSHVEQSSINNCVLCKSEKHLLYSCSKFLALPHNSKMSVLKSHDLCINCLRSGHFIRECKSLHRCRVCQRPHHSLLHSDSKNNPTTSAEVVQPPSLNPIVSHTASGLGKNLLLMTCRILVESPDGLSIEARGILDSASSASFVSGRLTQTLKLNQSSCNARISGIAGISHSSSTQSIATFNISPLNSPYKKMNISAIVVPRVTCDLPVVPISFDPKWSHMSDIRLADPKFGIPGRIDILLGVDVFVSALRQVLLDPL